MIVLPYQGLVNQAVDFYNRGNRYKPKTAQVSLFFRDEKFGLNDLAFDLLIDESHSIEFDISNHAVENGSSISDHITERLRSVQVTGLFTNHPIGETSSGYVNGDGSVNRAVDKVEISGQQAVSNVAREDKLDQLKKLAREKKPVRLVTSLEVYEEMVIESISFDRGPSDGESIKFTAKLREIRTAKVEYKNLKDRVWNPPAPPSQETDEGKKLAENEKEGKVTGAAQQASERIFSGVKGELWS